jgi:hypothetical protein
MHAHYIHSAARVSQAAATKAALRALGKGTDATLHLADGAVITGKLVDVGFRTVWLVTPANERSTAIDHVVKYENVTVVGGI